MTNSVTADWLRAGYVYEPDAGIIRNRHTGSVVGFKRKPGYVLTCLRGRQYRVHRLAWLWMTGEWPREIDHINRDRSDNRWANLRVANRVQQNANSARKNATGFKGVQLKRGRYFATIKFDGKRHWLGTFGDPASAHVAYSRAAREMFGEFACNATAVPRGNFGGS